MAGRDVVLPDQISRIITVGPVPVFNSFLFAFDKQKAIVNGTPPNLRSFHHQEIFAPELDGRPLVQGGGMGISIEAIVGLEPDLVLTMDRGIASTLEQRSIPVLYLRSCRTPEDIKSWLRILGQAFDSPQVAAQYAAYFDETIARVARSLTPLPKTRPRVLSCILRRSVQPSHITDWWIGAAGGHSVTEDDHIAPEVPFPLEQMLGWDPEILIVGSRAEMALAYADPRFQAISAVRNRRVHVSPAGAMRWSGATIEQPLTVLWAAGLIHPSLSDPAGLKREAASFYERIFHVRLAPDQIDAILAGITG